MRKKVMYTAVLLLTMSVGSVFAQGTLTIDYCQQKARENYPLIKQYDLLKLSKDYTLANISKAYLPQASLLVQASYQSDVTHLPIDIPNINIEVLDKDQYKASVDVSQLIWDGGQTRAQRAVATSGNEMEKQNVEVQLYALRDRVNSLFFGILSVDEQLKQLSLYEENLQSSRKIVVSLMNNGTASQADVDMVDVELLNLEQQRTSLTAVRRACVQMLGAMMGEELAVETSVQLPASPLMLSADVSNRPEISLFDSQRTYYQSQQKTIGARNMPKLALFAQGGYAKPALNMLSNDFALFGIGGIRLSWNFGGFYTSKNERRLLENQAEMVTTQEQTFKYNTNIQLVQVQNEIDKTNELIQQDDKLVQLRNRIRLSSESKYKNGVYTTNDLVRDINAESDARVQKAAHQVQQALNMYTHKYISGN